MTKRIYGLDILRAVAILLVVYGHSIYFFGNDINKWFDLGDGVALFFVLSGFLIGRILFKTVNNRFELGDLFKFWVRRWLRTLPAYFFVIIILMLLTHSYHPTYFAFTQNLFKGKIYFYIESWSLCVEEWFYLIVPVIFFVSLKFINRECLLFWILSIIIAVSVYRINITHSYMNVRIWDVTIRKTVVTRLDSIMYGVLTAYISIYSKRLWHKMQMNNVFMIGLTLWCLIVTIRNIFGFTRFSIWLELPFQSISCLLMIPYLSSIKSGKGLIFKFFTFISEISYSIYLLNFTVVSYILQVDRIQLWSKEYQQLPFIIFILVSFGGAYLVYKLVEKPFMDLRDRFILNKIQLKYLLKTKQIVR